MPYFNFINIACPATRAKNGRVYDPQVGAFLSPDPFVQAPYHTQSYNRYAYVFNNPMKYVDPSGYRLQAAFDDEARYWNRKQDDNLEALGSDNSLTRFLTYGNLSAGNWSNQYSGFYGSSAGQMASQVNFLVNSLHGGIMTDNNKYVFKNSFDYKNYISGYKRIYVTGSNSYESYIVGVTVPIYSAPFELEASSGGGNNNSKGGFGFGFSGGFASPIDDKSFGFGVGFFFGAKDRGIYLKKKKGKGVLFSGSFDMTSYSSVNSNYVELNDLANDGYELEFGLSYVGYSLSNNSQLYENGIYLPKSFNSHTISISDGMHLGYADWNTKTMTIPVFPMIGLILLPH